MSIGRHFENLDRYEAGARRFLAAFYRPAPTQPGEDAGRFRYSLSDGDGIKYSDRTNPNDRLDTERMRTAMDNYRARLDTAPLMRELERTRRDSFVDRLLALINAKGMKDSEVYKAAQIDRRLFSKIVTDREYKPSKDTALSLAFALRLSLPEVTDLLERAGYTLSHSSQRDLIFEYFFREQVYSIPEINQILYRLGQKLLGRENVV